VCDGFTNKTARVEVEQNQIVCRVTRKDLEFQSLNVLAFVGVRTPAAFVGVTR